MTQFKVIVEKHTDGYVAYPLGVKGVCVAEGETYEQALAEVRSAISFHLATFGKDALSEDDSPITEVFIAETALAVPWASFQLTLLTMPNHPILKSSTLRIICTQAGIPNDDFLRAYERG